MALPLRFVAEIHRRLALRFGSRWSGMWDGLVQEDVQADWAEQLGGLTPEGIRYALENLPTNFPPTAAEFRALANRAPIYAPPALPAPKPDRAGARRVAEHAAKALGGGKSLNQHADECFARLAELKARGALSVGQRNFLASAERGMGKLPDGHAMDFKPVPEHLLPPGMRKGAAA